MILKFRQFTSVRQGHVKFVFVYKIKSKLWKVWKSCDGFSLKIETQRRWSLVYFSCFRKEHVHRKYGAFEARSSSSVFGVTAAVVFMLREQKVTIGSPFEIYHACVVSGSFISLLRLQKSKMCRASRVLLNVYHYLLLWDSSCFSPSNQRNCIVVSKN